MDNHKICICLLTYARTDYAVRTLRCALDHVRYDGCISVHIADNDSSPEHRAKLYDLAGGYAHVQGVSVSVAERTGGYGRNFNLATQAVHEFANYILVLEDDWELLKPLDLNILIADLESEPRIDCIRLGYLSFTQALYAELLNVHDNKYLLFSPLSPEPHVFTGHPRLERVSYQRKVGPWPEGLAPGLTEFQVAHDINARTGVAWPLSLVHVSGDLFSHVGTIRSTDV